MILRPILFLISQNKLALTLFIVFLFGGNISSIAQHKPDISSWPGLQTIVQHFYSNYKTTNLEDDQLVKFSRNPKGWNIRLQDLDNKTIKDELFWSAEFKQFKNTISFSKSDGNANNYRSESELTDILSEQDYFDYNLFYGYTEWPNDVIEVLTPYSSELSDFSMNHLARAYSYEANRNLWPSTKVAGKYLKYDSTFNSEDIEKELIDEYINLSKKAIHAYRIIEERNPTFKTFIGKIRTVYSNQHLTAYMGLALIGRSDLAKMFLVDNLYSPFLLSMAKSQLESCQKNSIVITEGDTDTFLLMYAQEKFGIRNDVSIFNKSLIATGRYINYYKNIVDQEKRISTTLPISSYSLDSYELLVLQKYDDIDELYIDRVIELLTNQPELFPRYDLWNYIIIPSKKFKISIPRLTVNENIQAIDSLWNQDLRAVSFSIDNSYIERSELLIWDILSTNGLRRPIQFLSNLSVHFNLDNHLVNQGMVNTFFPFPSSLLNEGHQNILSIEFDFSNIDIESDLIDLDTWLYSIKFSYYLAMEQALLDRDTVREIKIIDRVVDHIGNKYSLYGTLDYHFARSYIKNGKTKKGANLMYAIFKDQCKKINLQGTNGSEKNEETLELIKSSYDDFTATSKDRKLKKEIKKQYKIIQVKNS